MFTTYNIRSGDTLSALARRFYGDANKSALILKSNPGLREPLQPGTTIAIAGTDRLRPPQLADTTLSIDGQIFRYWTEIRINRAIDTVDTVEFLAPMNSGPFKPFSYLPVVVQSNKQALFSGTIVASNPQISADLKAISLSCYSTPGVLADCTAPAELYPIEFNDQGLRDIAQYLLDPFGIDLDFTDDQGAVFERVALEPDNAVMGFLIDLAQQRGLLISSNEAGALRIWRPASAGATPVAVLEQGAGPVVGIEPHFSQQDYFSHITGIEPVVVGLAGSKYTVKNARLTGTLRPHSFVIPDTLDADVKAATEAKAGRMFANMVSYSVALSTWYDQAGSIWAPNTIVRLRAPDVFINSSYNFLIRQVELNKTIEGETATLNLILPGSLSGQQPEAMPWD